MFATRAGFKESSAQLFGNPGYEYWQLVELTTCQPWYLLTYKVATTDGGSMHQTIAIAWESTLASVIAGLPVDAAQGLFVMRRADSGQPNWTMREVHTLWAPAESEEQHTGPLLFSFRDDSRIYNSYFDVIETFVDGRVRTHSFAASS